MLLRFRPLLLLGYLKVLPNPKPESISRPHLTPRRFPDVLKTFVGARRLLRRNSGV